MPFDQDSRDRIMRNQRLVAQPAAGFTLLEMAFVIVVTGVLLALLAPVLVQTLRHEADQRGRADVDAARDAVLGYARAHRRLPVRLGGELAGQDSWRRPLRYRADARLQSTSDLCAETVADAELHVLVPNALDPATGVPVPIPAAFVIVGDGPDRRATILFPDAAGSTTDLRTTGDDIVAWVGLDELQALLCQEEEPADWMARFAFGPGSTALSGAESGALVVASTTPDGYALRLTGGQRVNLSALSLNYRLRTFTIMGWFKLAPDAPPFAPVISRQSGSQAQNWLVAVWGDAVATPPAPGFAGDELVFRATRDPDCPGDPFETGAMLPPAPGPSVRDNRWHFFAATMKRSGETYAATLCLSQTLADELLCQTCVRDGPPDIGPAYGAGLYDFFIGAGSKPGAGDEVHSFEGEIDDILVYDSPLSAAAVSRHYKSLRGFYQ